MFYDTDKHDKYLCEHFFPDASQRKGIFVDVGACEDRFLSISRHFIDVGWTVLSIEANPEYAAKLRKVRDHVIEVAASNFDGEDVNFAIYHNARTNMASWSGLELDHKSLHPWQPVKAPQRNVLVKVRTLNTILRQWQQQHPGLSLRNIDVVSIDVEGNELNVLQGLDLKFYRPKVFTIEECASPNGVVDPEIQRYLHSKGYRFHSRHVHNNYYVPQ